MNDFNSDNPIGTSIGTAKTMLENATTHYNNSVKDGMHKSADFWDGYIHAIRHILKAGGHAQ